MEKAAVMLELELLRELCIALSALGPAQSRLSMAERGEIRPGDVVPPELAAEIMLSVDSCIEHMTVIRNRLEQACTHQQVDEEDVQEVLAA